VLAHVTNISCQVKLISTTCDSNSAQAFVRSGALDGPVGGLHEHLDSNLHSFFRELFAGLTEYFGKPLQSFCPERLRRSFVEIISTRWGVLVV
jgi:hypothetical protein